MPSEDIFGDDEPIHDWEPEPWRPEVRCPQCDTGRVRFCTLLHEMSVYECELCRIRFEVDEGI